MWPIDRPQANPRNARTHSEGQVEVLAKNLEDLLMLRSLIGDEKDVLLAGHALLAEAGRVGWKEIPVLVLDHLSEEQKERFLIADNQLALVATWDEEKLGEALASLEAQLVDVGDR